MGGAKWFSSQAFTVLSNNVFDGYSLFLSDTKRHEVAIWDMGEELGRISTERNFMFEIFPEDLKLENLLNSNQDVVKLISELKHEVSTGELLYIVGDSFRGKDKKTAYSEQLRARKVVWAYERKIRIEEGWYKGQDDFIPYYAQQCRMRTQIIKKNDFLTQKKYIAGVDVAYSELELRMVGAIVILDAKTLEVVDQTFHEMEITFPYVPGLFSFREVPPILEAFKKLKIKPDLIVCNAHGIAHPKNVGMATHLGIELDIPTIGCAKKRLVGAHDRTQLGNKRGDTLPLIWDNEQVGVALRTQTGIKPMFVSIGHKVSLETAIDWVLKLCLKHRLPETTRQADQLVNKLLKERTEIDFFDDDEDFMASYKNDISDSPV